MNPWQVAWPIFHPSSLKIFVDQKYDAVIIGAGMSGMAAGIRMAMFEKKVLILERHSISGGLNSYYRRGKRQFDVGLHALTNFAMPGERKKPLTKLLKQLRIPHEKLKLNQQFFSEIHFPGTTLSFSNNFEGLRESISDNFPDQIDGFSKLCEKINTFDEVALGNRPMRAKAIVRQYIDNPTLLEMLFCPLLIYGSAWENDMDFSQFVIMFKALYMEGFSRPKGGVRSIIKILQDKLEETGCEVRFKTGVEKIITNGKRIRGVLTNTDEYIETPLVFSSAGYPETINLMEDYENPKIKVGKLSFTETILCFKSKPREYNQNATIIFYNNRSEYIYRRPQSLIDDQSAVVCFPNNFAGDDYTEGIVRITFMANYNNWAELDRSTYMRQKKELVLPASLKIAQQFLSGINIERELDYFDIFTPTTIKKYTGHWQGTVYGTPNKTRNGLTPIDGLIICGTDQGFLGIIGSLLSGVSMANLYGSGI